jgi:two-component system NtrC family sensor kinase
MREVSSVPRRADTGAGTEPSGPNGGAPGVGSAEMDAQRALSERPVISIRARISLAFLLCFVLICGTTITGMVFISSLNGRQQFLEEVENFVSEVQNARRFEKNFFLYGTDLYDGLNQIHAAERYLRRDAAEMQALMGKVKFESLQADLAQYEAALTKLVGLSRSGELNTGTVRQEVEGQLRRHGADILAEAQAMIDKERLAVSTLMHTSMVVATGALIMVLMIMVYIAAFLTRQIVRPLGRFMTYADRIAAGDYSPIYPQRKYRDEYSNLAMAMNRMLEELKRHQEQLLQSRKMAAIGTLTSGIAHELNNPLNNIGLTTESLIDNFDDYSDEQKLKMLDQIYQQVERASGSVRNLLDFTRTEKVPFTTLSIREVVESTLQLVQNELNLGHVALQVDIENDLPEIRGNPRNLQQVFLNLFLNSIQAMPKGGTLGVQARVDSDRFIRVSVSDTGVGIPPEVLDKVFDPFFTTKEPGQGTGLGLSVSYSIIEKHRGRITVESEVNKGTVFSIFLPYVDKSEQNDADTTESSRG